MTEVSNVSVVVDSNMTGFTQGMEKAANISVNFKNVLLETAKAAGALYVFDAVKDKLVSMTTGAMEHIDQQAKLARAIGASTAGFQGLAYAADLAGVNQEALAMASGKLNNKLGEAIQKGGDSAIAFERLGLSAKSLANMDADQRFATIADRIQKLGMDSTTAGFALKEMGLKGEEMRQFILDGGDQIRQAAQDVRDFGVALTNVESNKVEAANDAITRMGLIAKGAGNQIAVELSPYIRGIALKLADAAKEAHGFKKEIREGIEDAIEVAAKGADAFHYMNLQITGIALAASYVGESVLTVFTNIAEVLTRSADGYVELINGVNAASNRVFKTHYEMIELPSKSSFMEGLRTATGFAQESTKQLYDRLMDIYHAEPPSEKIRKFAEELKKAGENDALNTNKNRQGNTNLPDESETDKKNADKLKNIMGGLHAGTEALQTELDKRNQILEIYRTHQLSEDASLYQQQLNEILINEQLKQAEILAQTQQDAAKREEQKAQNLERVANDKAAMAAIIAEYDQQEVLAEEIKQAKLTETQESAQRARKKLQDAERQHMISTALGLGQQLMTVMQGHSKQGFEFAKKAAIASSVITGYRAAVKAWSEGMEVAGPPGAVAFMASSLLTTGAQIQSIRSTNFEGGGSGASSGAASAASVSATASAQAAAPAPTQIMQVQGIDHNQWFSGGFVEQIGKKLTDFQKDGGQVVWGGA